MTTTFEKRATAAGEFWSSKAPTAKLHDMLRTMSPARFKAASIGGEDSQGFEQAFSSLAYNYVKDKAPRLLDYLIGFQLVERNEDNTKALGIFGFKVGDSWMYVPVFFLNGDMKGHELLYLKGQDMFVPLKENWVNYLIGRRPHLLGEGSPQNTYQLGGMMPDIMRLSRIPLGTKYGSARLPEWTAGFLPVMAAAHQKRAGFLYRGAGGDIDLGAVARNPVLAATVPVKQAFDLETVLGSSLNLLKTAYEKGYTQYPRIKEGFDRFYGKDFFNRVAFQIKAAQSLLNVLPTQTARATKVADSLIPEAPAEPRRDLVIYAADNLVDEDAAIMRNLPELDDADREQLVRDTVLIKDKRDPHAVSMAYNTQTVLQLVNPNESGLYDVLERPGKFDEMVVISSPHTGRGREDFCVVLRKGSPRDWKNIHRSNLWVRQCDCPTPADWREYVDSLAGTESLQKGGTYLALNASGSGTCPFEVLEDYGDGVYDVRWHDHGSWVDTQPGHMSTRRERDRDWDLAYTSWRARVYITDREGANLRAVRGELSIPKSYKVIKIADAPKPSSQAERDSLLSCCDGEQSSNPENPIVPGNLIDVQIMLYKQASELRVHDTGTDVVLSGQGQKQRMTKKAALLALVRDHGLREEQARIMLKEAAALSGQNVAAKYLVKYAFGYPGGPNGPTIPQPYMGVEQNGPHAVSAIYPQEEEVPVDSVNSQIANPEIYDPWFTPDQGAMQTAQQAAASGQKEVFDTAMVSAMLKSVRQESLVDRYLSDFTKALSNLGRVLFLFFWHQEEFRDRYGKQDLPELEDTLRNTFESLGDLVLFLKAKSSGGRHMLAGAGVGNPADPDITEVSRN